MFPRVFLGEKTMLAREMMLASGETVLAPTEAARAPARLQGEHEVFRGESHEQIVLGELLPSPGFEHLLIKAVSAADGDHRQSRCHYTWCQMPAVQITEAQPAVNERNVMLIGFQRGCLAVGVHQLDAVCSNELGADEPGNLVSVALKRAGKQVAPKQVILDDEDSNVCHMLLQVVLKSILAEEIPARSQEHACELAGRKGGDRTEHPFQRAGSG